MDRKIVNRSLFSYIILFFIIVIVFNLMNILNTKVNRLSYSEFLNELENGNTDLEESIEKYTKAMKLVNICDKKLKDIEEQVSKIVTENGLEDFKIEE